MSNQPHLDPDGVDPSNKSPSGSEGRIASTLERERLALSLLQRAGRRNAPPAAVSNRVYNATLDVWATEVRRRQQVSRRAALAAGIVAIAIGAGAWLWHLQVAAVSVASITRLKGDVAVMRGDTNQHVSDRFALKTGDRIKVPEGSALAARRPDGLAVRVAGPAYLVWDSSERIRLDQGRMYVDVGTDTDAERTPFEVRTPLARIEHVGTRFVADATPARVRVTVRDGRVRITSVNGDALGLEGGQAAEAAVNGQITWVTPPSHADWEWVDAMAPACGIEGRSLFDVLTDLAHEGDLQLVFASPEIEHRAHDLTLHGPALDLPPRTAIDAVLATTDLDADLTGQRVVLRERMPGT